MHSSFIKGIVYPKLKFTDPHFISNLYYFLLQTTQKKIF